MSITFTARLLHYHTVKVWIIVVDHIRPMNPLDRPNLAQPSQNVTYSLLQLKRLVHHSLNGSVFATCFCHSGTGSLSRRMINVS